MQLSVQSAPAPSGLQTVKSSNVKGRGAQIEAEALGEDYHRVITAESTMTDEEEAVCHQLVQALDLRWKWLFRPAKLPEHDTVRCSKAARPQLCLCLRQPLRSVCKLWWRKVWRSGTDCRCGACAR